MEKPYLSVQEAYKSDVGRAIARLPEFMMKGLELKNGDVIEIKGGCRAVALAWPLRPEDASKSIIRIDATIRSNVQVSLSDKIMIKKVKSNPAKNISLSPVEGNDLFVDENFLKSKLIGIPIITKQKISIDYMGKQGHYMVSKVTPRGVGIIDDKTSIKISDKMIKEDDLKFPTVSYEDIGGLKQEIELVREMVEIPMRHPEVFKRLGIGSPKGVLMTGPPGTGKTLLAKAVAGETDSAFYSIAGPEIMSKFYGESEKQLRDVFEEAGKNAPAIIFIDEIDSIAPKRGESHDQVERRVVSQLLTLLDGLKARGQIVVMAATNMPDDIDEALRRPGRFDREIRINPPQEEGRKEILQIHSRGMPLEDDVDFDNIAERTIGYTGADIEVLCKEAAMRALKPYVPSLQDISDEVPTNVLDRLVVTKKDFDSALTLVEPSAMREVLIRTPKVSWDDIGGLEDVKKVLYETIELPMKKPELFKKAGIKPSKGVLLHGLPGTGKTMLAKAIAKESNANFISIKGPELISKWVGESEKQIRKVFQKARQVAPSIIFFDEFDSISKVRGQSLSDSTERMVNQLLTELDGIEDLEKVTVIAATNRKDLIDPSLLRPGRIDLNIEIPLPDEENRFKILEVHTRNMPIENIDLKDYARKTDGWSGADLESLTREAGMNAIRRDTETDDLKVISEDFDKAYEELRQKKIK